MEKRLKNYLAYIDHQSKSSMSMEIRNELKENLLIQIGFFQHERLIHLIVTVTFAVLALITLLCISLTSNLMYPVLMLLIGILLVPYIRHYFILERGVQKLYVYFDQLSGLNTTLPR